MAKRLAELRGLTPPINVEKLAKSLAETLFIPFPDWASADGFTLNLKVPNRKPQIILNTNSNELRQRFTLAHEIGHVIIPWHIGDIVDDVYAGSSAANDRYRRLEAEANRFAAELLMPTDWAVRICENSAHLRGALITIADVAQVSLAAAVLRIIQKGPKGYVAAYVRDDLVEIIGQTKGTAAALPQSGTPISRVTLSAFEVPQIYQMGGSTAYVWKELQSVALPGRPEEDWRTLLANILDAFPSDRRKSLQAQLNAIVGFRLGKHPKGENPEIIYKDVVKAFENRTDRNIDVATARKHPDFEHYVLARILDRSKGK